MFHYDSTYHVYCPIYYTNECRMWMNLKRNLLQGRRNIMGIPAWVRVMLRMEEVIDEGDVLDKDHKVRIQLMKAEIEFRNECVR